MQEWLKKNWWVAFFYVAVVAAVSIQKWFDIELDQSSFIVIAIVLLPFIVHRLTEIEAGGIRLTLGELKDEVADAKQRLERQQEIINQLVIYSPSAFVFARLRELYHCKKSGRAYNFEDNDAFRRELRYLLDHGFLVENFDLSTLQDGTDLAQFAELTPVGNSLVTLREAFEQEANLAKQGS